MAWDTPRVNGDIHYAADHNTEIDEIKSKALLVGGTLDGNLMSGTTPVLFDIAFPRNATPAVGSIFWEADNETATIQLHADCDLPIGLRELRRVYNPTGSTMLKGSAVYTNGIGGTPTVVAVALAQANAAATSIVLGVLSDDIEATHTGFCTVRGHVCIDTSAFDGAAGDSLYLSETVAGGLTSTPPISPNLLIRMGRLIVKDVEPDGKINVRLTTLYALGTLSDVSVPSPVANQILKFNGVSWVAADTTTVSSAGGTDFYLTGNHANPIEGISRAAAAVVTWTGHGQSTGASCAFWGITQADWTALNSTAAVPIWYKITVTSVDAFTIAVNTSGYAAPYNPAVDNGTVSIGIIQNSPDTAIVTQTDSADAGSSTGEVLMTTFQTPLPLGRTVLTGGEWVFKTWCYASSATDVNTIVIRVYKRDTAGAETQLFYAETADLGIVNTLSQITVINGSFATLVTDHLVVKYFAKSNRAAAGVRRLYLTHNGTDKYSFVKTPLSLSHASLDFLQYSNAGHVGFAPSNPLATDTLWDAAGDMVIGTGPNTAHKLAAGAATTILKGGGAADPVWTTVTGTDAPVCAGSPTFTGLVTTPAIKITTGASPDFVLTSDADGDSSWVAPLTHHGALTGLTDDDHVRYFDKDGSKELTGLWLKRNVNNSYLIMLAGTARNNGAELWCGGNDALAAYKGGCGCHIADAAKTDIIIGWRMLGCTDTPFLDMLSHRIAGIAAPTTAGDALIYQAWAAWTPTLVWNLTTPAGLTTVARWTQTGKIVSYVFSTNTADSDGRSLTTVTLPVAPANIAANIACASIETSGAAGVTYTNPLAYIKADGSDNKINFRASVVGTNGQFIAYEISGSYEVA